MFDLAYDALEKPHAVVLYYGLLFHSPIAPQISSVTPWHVGAHDSFSGIAFALTSRHTRAMSDSPDFSGDPKRSIPVIDTWLPQTQCTRCGYPRCRDYATAIHRGEAGINRCPPGGNTTINGLAKLLQQKVVPLDPECGLHEPRVLAVIIEPQCIGCKLCIQACPVDAIIGRAKRMHTVLPELCTGCELCLPVCPVDCIDLVNDSIHQTTSTARWPEYAQNDVRQAHQNTVLRLRRLQTIARQRAQKRKSKAVSQRERIRAEIRAAVERDKQRRKAK